jgi:hypothetical protein
MTVTHIGARRRPAQSIILLIALGVVLVLTGAAYLVAGLGAALAVALALPALLVAGLGGAARTRRAARRVAPSAGRAQRAVLLADGSARQAIVVPLERPQSEQLVLTAEGYLLLNAEGRPIHRIGDRG